MALDAVVEKRMGRELIDHLVFQTRAALLRGAGNYIKSMAVAAKAETDKTLSVGVIADIRAQAIKSLKEEIDTPNRLRSRINEGIRVHGQQRIKNAFLAAGGDMTIAEFNADLASLETYADELVVRAKGGEALSLIAEDIQTNVADKVSEWNFPLPKIYKDIWSK